MAEIVVAERERVLNWLSWMGCWPEAYESEQGADALRAAIVEGLELLDVAELQAVLWMVVGLGVERDRI